MRKGRGVISSRHTAPEAPKSYSVTLAGRLAWKRTIMPGLSKGLRGRKSVKHRRSTKPLRVNLSRRKHGTTRSSLPSSDLTAGQKPSGKQQAKSPVASILDHSKPPQNSIGWRIRWKRFINKQLTWALLVVYYPQDILLNFLSKSAARLRGQSRYLHVRSLNSTSFWEEERKVSAKTGQSLQENTGTQVQKSEAPDGQVVSIQRPGTTKGGR